MEQKRKKLEKLQRSFQSKKAEAADLQGSFQREREDLLEDIYILTRQIKLKDLLIASYIPPHHQQCIMQHCTWDEMQQCWQIRALAPGWQCCQSQTGSNLEIALVLCITAALQLMRISSLVHT